MATVEERKRVAPKPWENMMTGILLFDCVSSASHIAGTCGSPKQKSDLRYIINNNNYIKINDCYKLKKKKLCYSWDQS